MLEVDADRETAARLAARADVARVAANRPSVRKTPGEEARPRDCARGGLCRSPQPRLIGAPALWDLGFTGQGIVIGVADTGLEWDHPALQNRYRGWDGVTASHDYNWHDAVHDAPPSNPCGSDAPAPCDDHGHGTGIAGFALGQRRERHDRRRSGSASDRLPEHGGRRGHARALRRVLRVVPRADRFARGEPAAGPRARRDQQFVGLSAGGGLHGSGPSERDGGHHAGGGDRDVLRRRKSGRGLLDPGQRAGGGARELRRRRDLPRRHDRGVLRVRPRHERRLQSAQAGSDRAGREPAHGGAWAAAYVPRFSGTSASAPHVAGAFALLWSAAPGLRGNVDGTEEILEHSAVPLRREVNCGPVSGSAIPNPIFGWGRLDVASLGPRGRSRDASDCAHRRTRDTRSSPRE